MISRNRLVLVAALSCVATTAHAQWARHHGGECRASSGIYRSTHAVTGFGSTNTSPGHTIWLACRSDDTDQYPDSTVNTVRLYVHDASPTDGFTVRACITRRESEGGECSASYTTGTTFVGDAVITISRANLDEWRNTIDFSSLLVEIPAKHGSNSFSYLKGWVTEP
jgi:hypothetical protein